MEPDLRSLLILAAAFLLPAIVVVGVYAVIFLRRGHRKRQRITSRGHRHREAHQEENEEA